jgi:hypothetical protein
LGRFEESAEAWVAASAGGGVLAAIAWIEVAKLREHRFGDPTGAFEAVRRAWRVIDRSRALGRPLTRLEADIVQRGARLRERLRRGEAAVGQGAA